MLAQNDTWQKSKSERPLSTSINLTSPSDKNTKERAEEGAKPAGRSEERSGAGRGWGRGGDDELEFPRMGGSELGGQERRV